MNRRHFLAATGATAATLAATAQDDKTSEKAKAKAKPAHTGPNRIGVSSYSFWGFRRKELRSLELNLDHAARMGFDGLEILIVNFLLQFSSNKKSLLKKRTVRDSVALRLDGRH